MSEAPSPSTAVAPTQNKQTSNKVGEAPKRPLSSYNLFFLFERRRILAGAEEGDDFVVTPEEIRTIAQEHENKPRRRHRKSHGMISFKDLARTLADRWKSLDASKKKVFEEQARALWGEYEEKLQEYNNSNPVAIASAADGGTSTSSSDGPEQQPQQRAAVENAAASSNHPPGLFGTATPAQQAAAAAAALTNHHHAAATFASPHASLAVTSQHHHHAALAQQAAAAAHLNGLHAAGGLSGASQFLSSAGSSAVLAASLPHGLTADSNGLSRLGQASYYAAAAAAAGNQTCLFHENPPPHAHLPIARKAPGLAALGSLGGLADSVSSSSLFPGLAGAEHGAVGVGAADAQKTTMLLQQSIDLYLASQNDDGSIAAAAAAKRKLGGNSERSGLEESASKKLKSLLDGKPSATDNGSSSMNLFNVYRYDPQDAVEVTQTRMQFCLRGRPRWWNEQDPTQLVEHVVGFQTATTSCFMYHFGLVPKYQRHQLLTLKLIFCFPREQDITTMGSMDSLVKFVVETLQGKLYDLTGQIVSVVARKKYDVPGGSGYTNILLDVDPDFTPSPPTGATNGVTSAAAAAALAAAGLGRMG